MPASDAAVALRPSRALRALPWVFVLIWSTGFVVARFAMPHAPALRFLSVRYACSVVCFAGWIAVARPRWPAGRSQWLHLAVVGVLVQAGYLGGVWTAVRAGLGAGTVALLVGLQPVLTALWTAVVAQGDAPGIAKRQWAGLVLGFAGLVLVVEHKLAGGEIGAWNLSMAVFALVSITAGTLYQKRFVAPCDLRTAGFVQLAAALVVSLPVALLEPGTIDWQPDVVGALAWSVLVLTLGGSSLFYVLIQRGEATEVTSLLYLVPPCTALMAWILFGEAFTVSMAAGLALTAAGVALVVRTAAMPTEAGKR